MLKQCVFDGRRGRNSLVDSVFEDSGLILDQANDPAGCFWSKSDFDTTKSRVKSSGHAMLKENSNQPYEPEIPDKQQPSEPQDLELIP